ncbi:MAG: glycosyltransferase family 9 protein [Candidatus Omnitrophica bacterium]|nr:glycosyltransferase family 9 protein [Candidatus Omnitrophota bacterium]
MYVYKKRFLVLFFTIFDAIGRAIFFPVRLVSRFEPVRVKKILVIRLDHIGDVVNSTVVIGPLRKNFPEAKIHFLAPVWAASVVNSNRDISRVIEFRPSWFDRNGSKFFKNVRSLLPLVKLISKEGYDLCIDLRGDSRHILAMFLGGVKYRVGYGITGCGFLLNLEVRYKGIMHETRRNLELLKAIGIDIKEAKIDLSFPDGDKVSAGLLLKEIGLPGDYAVMHPFPGDMSKEWEDKGFMRIIGYLWERYSLPTVIAGGKVDAGKFRPTSADGFFMDISGKTTLGSLYFLLKRARIFIGVDSAPAHLAGAAGTASVVLMNGTHMPAQWLPKGDKVRAVIPAKGKVVSGLDAGEVEAALDELMGQK